MSFSDVFKSSFLENVGVTDEVADVELRYAVLLRTEDLARSSEPEVFFCDSEAV